MLDFRRSSKPAPLSDYRERRRWLIAILGIGTVLIMIGREIQTGRITKYLLGSPTEGENEQIDTRLGLERDPEAPLDQISMPLPKLELEDAPEPGTYLPGLETSLLSTVQDGTVQNRPGEREIFFHLFDLLNRTPQDELEAFLAGRIEDKPVAFTQLFQQSEHYRGKVIRVHEVARGVFPVQLRKNKFGLEKYYQVWLQTRDRNVMAAYVLNLPPGFPLSEVSGTEYERVNEEVEFVGIFYKRMAYQANDDMRSTPLIFAKTLKWHPRKVEISEPWSWGTILSVIAGGAMMGVVLAYILFTSAKAKEPRNAPSDGAIAALDKIEAAPDVGEQLAELAKEPESAATSEAESAEKTPDYKPSDEPAP